MLDLILSFDTLCMALDYSETIVSLNYSKIEAQHAGHNIPHTFE